jgi:branched-chain amino acid transport system permease protein
VPSHLGLDFDVTEIASGIYGFLLVIIMLLRPAGLLPDRVRAAARLRRSTRRR